MKDYQISWSLAILIHLLFILFLYLYQIQFPKRLEVENIEVIAIEDFLQNNIENNSSAPASNTKNNTLNSQVSIAQTKISLPGTTSNFEDAVKVHNLPLKRDKIINDKLMSSKIDESFSSKSQSLNNNLSASHSAGLGNSPSALSGSGTNTIDGSSSFKLEGDAVNRQLMKKVLPKYPDDMQKDGVVSLKFAILPDGTVSEIVIIKKSDPVFENLSISSLNQWKFNRSEKKNTGIITFHFKLD
jgi:outer membrane biosynthesis protein TonB